MNKNLIPQSLRNISHKSSETQSLENLPATILEHQRSPILPTWNGLINILIFKNLQQSLFINGSLCFIIGALNRRQPLLNLIIIVFIVGAFNFKKVLYKTDKVTVALIVPIKTHNILIDLLTLCVHKENLSLVIPDDLNPSQESLVLIELDLLRVVLQEEIDEVPPLVSDQQSEALLISGLNQLLRWLHPVY